MKRTIYIESIEYEKDGESGYWYAPVAQNAKWIFEALSRHSVSCEQIRQHSDRYWDITIKGKKKNIRVFIAEFVSEASSIYSIREY